MFNKPINILYILYGLNNGGAETLAIRLCEHLDRQLFAPTYCSLSDDGPLRQKLLDENISFVTLGKKEGKDLSQISKLRHLLSSKKIDLVHTHNQGPLLYTVLASFPLKSWKLVHTEHINMGQEFSYHSKHQLYNTILYRRLDGFIAIADHLSKSILAEHPFLNNKMVTIRNAVPEDHLLHSGHTISLRKELGLSQHSVLLGNISALRPQKDHRTMLLAMKEITRQRDETHLVIAGEGEKRDELQRLRAELNLEDKVHFLGYRSDVAALLSQFDLFLLTSLYEGLPLCLLEAMAAGCVIVATDVVGTNELARNNQTAKLVQPENPTELASTILILLNQPDEMRHLRQSASHLLKREFSFANMITTYQNYYLNITNNTNGTKG